MAFATLITDVAVNAAQAAQKKWGIPASVSLAQYGLESGWGAHMPANSNNPFGIKARPGEPTCDAVTREHLDGAWTVIHAGFRKFANLAEAFDCHAELLAERRCYIGARKDLPDPLAFCRDLTGVYATDPAYGAKLIGLIHTHNLTQFDKVPA